jgi:hypothetical protein
MRTLSVDAGSSGNFVAQYVADVRGNGAGVVEAVDTEDLKVCYGYRQTDVTFRCPM